MSEDPEISYLEGLYRELKYLREQEEVKFCELLSLVDQRSRFPLPHEYAEKLEEIKDKLNRSWDVSKDAFSITDQEKRFFWRQIAQHSAQYMHPFVHKQKEFNATVVHLLNDFIASVTEALAQIRLFHHTLIQYFQRVLPVLDSKDRETICKGEHQFAVHAQRVRDHIDLLYQELDRRMEAIETDPSPPSAAATQQSSRMQERIYYSFEQNFRGTREEIKERFSDYLHYFEKRPSEAPVLDLGCGRGEFIELLKQARIPALGVDSNGKMVQNCREQGLEVWEDDLLNFLQSQKENSLSGIFCSQVIEHLPSGYLLAMLQCAFARLQKGATIVLETVNVASAFSFLHVYLRDLTHTTPCYPETLKFLVDACGFQHSEIVYRTSVQPDTALQMFNDPSDDQKKLLNENMRRLNRLLFDFQEYAVVATK